MLKYLIKRQKLIMMNQKMDYKDCEEIIRIIDKIKENEDKAKTDIKLIDEKLTLLYGHIIYSNIKNKLLTKILGINLQDELRELKRYISRLYSYIIICNEKNIKELEKELEALYFKSLFKKSNDESKDE